MQLISHTLPGALEDQWLIINFLLTFDSFSHRYKYQNTTWYSYQNLGKASLIEIWGSNFATLVALKVALMQ